MFISSEAYLAAISNATETDQSLSIAVAFWGSGSENLLNSATGKVRIICNLLIGGTNPEPISIMLDKTNIEIRHSSTLHAKVLLCDDRAIVGSANYSTNGLHYEDDELSGWDEAGIETRDPNLLKSIQDWFENLWMTSDVVTPSDIELAQFRWDIARRNRISQSAKTGLLNLPLSALKDKAIYVALWTNDPSVEAVETINSILEDTSVAIGGTAIDPISHTLETTI